MGPSDGASYATWTSRLKNMDAMSTWVRLAMKRLLHERGDVVDPIVIHRRLTMPPRRTRYLKAGFRHLDVYCAITLN
jgi:hypothetical protein